MTFGGITGSVGGGIGVFGEAAVDDLLAQSGNQQDEFAMTFADYIFSWVDVQEQLTPGTSAFNQALVHQIAYTTTHEAFHTFGLVHTVGPDFPSVSVAELLMTDGDAIRPGASSTAKNNPFMVTRMDLPRDLRNYPSGTVVAEPNDYLYLRDNADIGLRDDDRDGVPNLSYVTGTGGFDKITLDRDASNPNLVHVTVAAYTTSVFTTLIQQETYDIDLTLDTEGEILIDAGLSNDLIEIDADIAASVRIRGMVGDDRIKVRGQGSSALRSFVVDGEGGDDTFTIDFQYGDPLPQPGFDFNFIGGEGTDNVAVVEAGEALRTGYFVNALADAADISVGDGRADSSAAGDDQTTLRAAIQEANAAANTVYVFLPAGTHTLSVSGSGGDSQGDLDITKYMKVIGAGAGATIIDASTLAERDRVFEVAGGSAISFDLRRVTLTGGLTTGGGGAIRVNNSTNSSVMELWLTEAAIVGNESSNSHGGGILAQSGTVVYVNQSVVTSNTASGSGNGGGIYTSGSSATVEHAAAVLDRTIIANNAASTGYDLWSDAGAGWAGLFISAEGNLFTSTAGSNLASAGLQTSDHVGAVDRVVTSVVDSSDHTDDARALSLREAIDWANLSDGTPESLWLPAWRIVLTRKSSVASISDHDIAFGDLEVTDSLIVRGAGSTPVQVSQIVTEYQDLDAAFDLLGDYQGDGIVLDDGFVDGSDYLIWQYLDPESDGDDDGDVDSDDLTVLQQHFGNTLLLINVAAL